VHGTGSSIVHRILGAVTDKAGEQPWWWLRDDDTATQPEDAPDGAGHGGSEPPPRSPSRGPTGYHGRAQQGSPAGGQPSTDPAAGHGQPSTDPAAGHGQPSTDPAAGHGQPWTDPAAGHGQPWTDPAAGHGQPWTDPAAGYGKLGYGRSAKRRPGRALVVTAGVAGLVAAAVTGGLVGHALTASHPSATVGAPSSGGGDAPGTGRGFGGGFPYPGGSPSTAPTGSGGGSSDAAAIASRVDPGLVDINTIVDYGEAQAAGTGMVLTAGGEVLTNNHVIEGATSISVTDVGNGKTYSASVVGYSVSSDVAVIQLNGASGLQTVTTANAPASVGEQVVGIGNAGGTGGTPSYAGGTVTATDQSIMASDDLTGTNEQLTGMIETNADIQAGDSGGSLVNDSGQVIGMDTAGSSSGSFQFAGQAQGTGYAIPIGTATSIAGLIVAGHSSSSVHVGPTAFLGVSTGGENTGGSAGFGGYGGGGFNSVSGVQISGVVASSAAADAGLAAGDVITSVGGYSVTSQSALQDVMVDDMVPGQVVTVGYTDTAGQEQAVTLTLGSGPPA
jgi:S1-C subfamily serine protease